MSKDNVRDINCAEAIKLIAAYVDKQAGESDTKTLERHLESCHHCFDRVEFEKLLKSRMRGLKIDTSTMKLSTKARRMLEDL